MLSPAAQGPRQSMRTANELGRQVIENKEQLEQQESVEKAVVVHDEIRNLCFF